MHPILEVAWRRRRALLGQLGRRRSGRLRVPLAFRRDSRVLKSVVLHWPKTDPGELIQLRGLTECGPFRALDTILLSDSGTMVRTRLAENDKVTFRRSRHSRCAAFVVTALRDDWAEPFSALAVECGRNKYTAEHERRPADFRTGILQ